MRRYSFLGPAGTFTETALKQVKEAEGQIWQPVANVSEALNDVVTGRSDAAMIAIENSVDGGVTVAQDALATMPDLQITGEYLVPVSFILVARPGMSFEQVSVIGAHPVAYAQCQKWLGAHLPGHVHLQAGSNVQSVSDLFTDDSTLDAAIAPPSITDHYEVDVLATGIEENPNAETRFVLVERRRKVGQPTGHDKTSIIAELPEDRAGALLDMLEQFATRGVNLTLIASRPVGDRMGRYRFVIDAEGHVREERVADALLGLKRVSPSVAFLGSYPRADGVEPDTVPEMDDRAFRDARDWLRFAVEGDS
jgi:prephenate dehydratase